MAEHVSDANSVEHMSAVKSNAGVLSKLRGADDTNIVFVCLVFGGACGFEAGEVLVLALAASASVATFEFLSAALDFFNRMESWYSAVAVEH